MKHRIIATFVLLVASVLAFSQQRQKVALVLGGGGAKGAAEVGVLKYIEKSGIPIDFVVGTSIGSIVGGLYSVGYNSEQLDSVFRSQKWISLLTNKNAEHTSKVLTKENGVNYFFGAPIRLGKKKPSKSRKLALGFLKGDSVVSMLDKMIVESPAFRGKAVDSLHFDKLPKPYRCVAVDLKDFSEVVLDRGNLATAMRASMAVPFAFRPIVIDGHTLIDGGIINNLPVDVAKAMGADVVIAVDLEVVKEKKNAEGEEIADEEEEADGDTGEFKPIHKLGLLNMVKWGMKRPDKKKYEENVAHADVYIHPKLNGYGAQSFTTTKVAEMIAIGEEAGKNSLDDLIRLKKQIYKKSKNKKRKK